MKKLKLNDNLFWPFELNKEATWEKLLFIYLKIKNHKAHTPTRIFAKNGEYQAQTNTIFHVYRRVPVCTLQFP
jgi:hypothetical protein